MVVMNRYREWAVVLQSEQRPSRPLVSGEVPRSWAGACLTPKQATEMATSGFEIRKLDAAQDGRIILEV